MRGRAPLLERRLGREAARQGSSRTSRVRTDDHPLLRLQRSAGNRAVTGLVLQRDKASTDIEQETFFSSKVSLSTPHRNYRGKCNASFSGVRVERHWEWGLLSDDIAVVFVCGPQRFRFRATKSFGSGMPWAMVNARGGSGGWVLDPIEAALKTIYEHWDDDKRFGPATRVVIDALQSDVENYCSLEKAYRRKQAAEGAGGFWDQYR